MAKSKSYYVVLSRAPTQLWAIEFGAYDSVTVQDEMRDLKRSYERDEQKMLFKLIRTKDDQASINAAVELLNNEIH